MNKLWFVAVGVAVALLPNGVVAYPRKPAAKRPNTRRKMPPPVALPVLPLIRPPAPPPMPSKPVPPPVNPSGTPPSLLNNAAEWFPESAYPADARRAGATGRVSMWLRLDRQGRPYQCTVVGSSGWPSLDTTACYLAQNNARFSPATDPDGKPIEWTYPMSIRWELQDDDPPSDSVPPVPLPPPSGVPKS